MESRANSITRLFFQAQQTLVECNETNNEAKARQHNHRPKSSIVALSFAHSAQLAYHGCTKYYGSALPSANIFVIMNSSSFLTAQMAEWQERPPLEQ